MRCAHRTVRIVDDINGRVTGIILVYTTVKQTARVSRIKGSVVVVVGLLPPRVTGSAGIVLGGCSFAGGFPTIYRFLGTGRSRPIDRWQDCLSFQGCIHV